MLTKYICISIALICAVYTEQVPGGFTDAEIQRIFHRNRNDVPKYKTVTLVTPDKLRSKREVRPVEFEVNGEKFQLQLTPIEYNSVSRDIPVWTVETDYQKASRHTYKKLDKKEIDYDGILYEDKDKMALLSAYYKNGYIYYDGVFGEGRKAKVVRSMPEKWWEFPSNNKSHTDHVVFDVNEGKTGTEAISPSEPTTEYGTLEKPLDVFYPKLLLVIEHNLFELLGKNVSETIQYVSTFWNAVNLKYSKLTSPKIKIVITGIIIAKDHSALQYIHSNRIPPEMVQTNHVRLLLDGGSYFLHDFHNEVDFRNYDATMTMSRLNTGSAGGSAYIGEICGMRLNVGFFNDDASYSGMLAATHELGHLLNLPHDGEGAAKECDENPNEKAGSVMFPFAAWVENHFWSECSKRILQKFAMNKRAECMRYPHRREN